MPIRANTWHAMGLLWKIKTKVMEVGDESIEAIYDTFMESIIESKEIALKEYE